MNTEVVGKVSALTTFIAEDFQFLKAPVKGTLTCKVK
jgi:hypothetical protein